jgi:hypothetical protein
MPDAREVIAAGKRLLESINDDQNLYGDILTPATIRRADEFRLAIYRYERTANEQGRGGQ